MPRYRGQHRAPTAPLPIAKTVAATSAALALGPALGVVAASASDTTEALDLIAECESGGRNVANSGGGPAFGPWQILPSTWLAHGGDEFAPTPRQATVEQQRVVAERILAARPDGADWNPSKGCWGSRFDAALAGQDVTDVHPGGGAAVAAPAPAPVPAAPVIQHALPTVAAGGVAYTVCAGDVLSRIALAHATTVERLVELNHIANPDLIFPGQVIQLVPVAQDGTSYTVAPGDQLGHIAQSLGMDTHELAEANHLANPDLIFPGQVLNIGGQGVSEGTLSTEGWGPAVQASIRDVSNAFDIETVLTRTGHSPSRDLAADFMIGTDAGRHAQVLAYILANRDRLGVDYVISRQHIYGAWTGWGPQLMEDRGSMTANHFDHIHISYKPSFAYSGAPVTPVPALPALVGHTYEVRVGDTLTEIAQHVGMSWQALYGQNRSVVGANPDLIFPGMDLTV